MAKGLNDVKILQSSQQLNGQFNFSETNIICENKKPPFPCIHPPSVPTNALQGCGELEPISAHSGGEHPEKSETGLTHSTEDRQHWSTRDTRSRFTYDKLIHIT